MMTMFNNSTRSRREVGENSNIPTFQHQIRNNVVVPDQGGIGEDLAEDPTRKRILLWGTILNGTYGIHKNLHISLFLPTIFGPI